MTTHSILLVEDNRELADEIAFFLSHHGYEVQIADSGEQVDAWIEQHVSPHSHGIILLDLGLPGEDGISIAQRLSVRQDLRLIMMTARSTIDDRISGFLAGADVYLTKPVNLHELLAVIQRIGQRMPTQPKQWLLHHGNMLLTSPDDTVIKLTTQETHFIHLLFTSPEQALDRQSLESGLWGTADLHADRRLEVMVARLRQKITAETNADSPIQTRWRYGYQFSEPLQVVDEWSAS